MMGVLALVLGLLTITRAVTLWQVFVLAFLLGLNNCFENPARQSFVLEMVGPDAPAQRGQPQLGAGQRRRARSARRVAGLIIAAGGIGICFLLNAVSFVAVVVSLLRLDTSALQPSRAGRARRRVSCARVCATCGAHPELGVPLLMMALVGCLAYEFQVVLPVVAKQTFDGGAADVRLHDRGDGRRRGDRRAATSRPGAAPASGRW